MTPARDDGNAQGLAEVIKRARRELELFIGRGVDSVSSVRRSDGGWTLSFEVVELQRIPDSTSVLGSYETIVDEDGGVVEYERTRRYYRNQASEVDA